MRLEVKEVQVKRIINVHKHVDGPWFWGKYTAHPYMGCRSGCEFCYARGSRYAGGRDPDHFDQVLKVKVNAVDRLRRELPRLAPEIISVGDWQEPLEGRYRLSRQMLEVVLLCGFPLFIVERSPSLVRDLDLLQAIHSHSYAGVLLSLSSLDPTLKRVFEPHSPGVRARLRAMATLSAAGLPVGASLMPILPFRGDSEVQVDRLVSAIKDHGGRFVVGSGLTMDGAQAARTLRAALGRWPEDEPRWRELYRWPPGGSPTYGPSGTYHRRLGLMIRTICEKHGLLDRMPRYIPAGPLAPNKRLSERLFLRVYDLELEGADEHRIWACRRAAWAVDELGEPVNQLYTRRGKQGLLDLPGVGPSMAALLEAWIRRLPPSEPL